MDDVGPNMVVIVMTVVTIVTVVLDRDDIVVAMMGMTVQLPRVVVVAGLMAMMAGLKMRPLRLSRLQLIHPWIMVSLKLLVGNGRVHVSLLHFLQSTTVPSLLLRGPSRTLKPLVRVSSVTSDEVETLATGLVPGPRASLFDLDGTVNVRPAHSMREFFFAKTGELELQTNDIPRAFAILISDGWKNLGDRIEAKLAGVKNGYKRTFGMKKPPSFVS